MIATSLIALALAATSVLAAPSPESLDLNDLPPSSIINIRSPKDKIADSNGPTDSNTANPKRFGVNGDRFLGGAASPYDDPCAQRTWIMPQKLSYDEVQAVYQGGWSAKGVCVYKPGQNMVLSQKWCLEAIGSDESSANVSVAYVCDASQRCGYDKYPLESLRPSLEGVLNYADKTLVNVGMIDGEYFVLFNSTVPIGWTTPGGGFGTKQGLILGFSVVFGVIAVGLLFYGCFQMEKWLKSRPGAKV